MSAEDEYAIWEAIAPTDFKPDVLEYAAGQVEDLVASGFYTKKELLSKTIYIFGFEKCADHPAAPLAARRLVDKL
jgi:hypothetical protein